MYGLARPTKLFAAEVMAERLFKNSERRIYAKHFIFHPNIYINKSSQSVGMKKVDNAKRIKSKSKIYLLQVQIQVPTLTY